MTESELRTVVREAIARHAASSSPFGQAALAAEAHLPLVREHPSHGLFPVSAGADDAGPCIIEPSVPCNHCGYCKSLGH